MSWTYGTLQLIRFLVGFFGKLLVALTSVASWIGWKSLPLGLFFIVDLATHPAALQGILYPWYRV